MTADWNLSTAEPVLDASTAGRTVATDGRQGGQGGQAAGAGQLTFGLRGALAGARQTLPLAISTCVVGTVFGVLAKQAGLTLVESALMSALVFAGAAQFVALGLWLSPLPIATIVLTTFVVNLRHVLFGAALRPWFARLSPLKVYGSAFFLSDESWALTIRALSEGGRDRAFLLGSGATILVAWVGATVVGQLVGATLPAGVGLGLDFAFTAAFLALIVGMWKGRASLLPWTVAAVTAIAAAHWLPGKWYILAGALAGSIAGAVFHAD
jgi:4-azaleucine resistance transporter AzlC